MLIVWLEQPGTAALFVIPFFAFNLRAEFAFLTHSGSVSK